MRVTRQYSTGGDNVWRVECVPIEERGTHFPQPLCQRAHALGNDLDHDTAPEPVILSGPGERATVRCPRIRGPDLVDSI